MRGRYPRRHEDLPGRYFSHGLAFSFGWEQVSRTAQFLGNADDVYIGFSVRLAREQALIDRRFVFNIEADFLIILSKNRNISSLKITQLKSFL